jgi:hypothetical protein
MNKNVMMALMAAVLVSLIPSLKSIWIDEAQDLAYAQQETASQFIGLLKADELSQAMMPLSMAVAWAWDKMIPGQSEWAYRSINMVWGWLTVFIFYLMGRRFDNKWLPLFFAVQPMFWFYGDEFRPFVFSMFLGALLLYVYLRVRDNQNYDAKSAGILSLCSALLIAANILTAPLVAVVWGFYLYGLLSSKQLAWKHPMLAVLGVLPALPAIIHLIQKVFVGSGHKVVLCKPGLLNVAFSIFEVGGFLGFSPGREAMRSDYVQGGLVQMAEGVAVFLPLMILLLMVYIWSLITAIRRGVSKWGVLGLCVFACSSGLLIVLALLKGTSFWARHFSAFFPAYVFGLGMLLKEIGAKRMGLLCSLLLASSLMIRFSNFHEKDDYRRAAHEASVISGRGGFLWWAANDEAAQFYGLNESDKVKFLMNPSMESLNETVYFPRAIILSKPDIFDGDRAIREFANMHNYTKTELCRSFLLFSKP